MPGPSAAAVTLSPELREFLESIVRSQTAEVRLVRRAQIALLAEQNVSNAEIARKLDFTEKTVRLWRARIASYPDLLSLFDRPRSGRPRDVPLEVRLQLVRLACERPEDDKTPFRDIWTQEALQEALIAECGWWLSTSEIGRILRARDIRPHRIRMWLNSQDPDFGAKARKVCRYYLDPPPGATVLCIDEKRLFAHERLAPLRAANGRWPVRKEFGYRRKGTSTLLGAFDVRTGEVYGECRPRRTAADLLEFLETLADHIPGQVVVIWDNLNVHMDGADHRWSEFNTRHGGRFTFVYTPIHASWLNQIEIWFSTLERRLLRHGSFASVEVLTQRVEDFIRHYNTHEAHPYRWTFRAQQGKKTSYANLQGREGPSRATHQAAA